MGPRVTCGDSDLAQRCLRMARYTNCARRATTVSLASRACLQVIDSVVMAVAPRSKAGGVVKRGQGHCNFQWCSVDAAKAAEKIDKVPH